MGKSWVALCDVNGSCKKPTRSPRISESQRFHKLQGSLDHLCKTLLNQSWLSRGKKGHAQTISRVLNSSCLWFRRCPKLTVDLYGLPAAAQKSRQQQTSSEWWMRADPSESTSDVFKGSSSWSSSLSSFLIFFDLFWTLIRFVQIDSKLIPTNCFNIGFSWSGWNLHFHPMSVTEVGAAVLCTTSRHCEGFAGICGALVGKTNTKHINVSHIMPYRTPCQPWKSACFLSLRCVLFGCLWAGRLLLISRSGSLIGGPSSRLWRNQQTTSSRTEKRMVLDFERSQMLGLHKSNSERHEWLYS